MLKQHSTEITELCPMNIEVMRWRQQSVCNFDAVMCFTKHQNNNKVQYILSCPHTKLLGFFSVR